MKINIKYWLLILLATNSFNLIGQDSLIFKKDGGYLKNIHLNDFISEINQNQVFSNKLRNELIEKGELQETVNGFLSKDGDVYISLDFNVRSNNDNTKVLGISIPTLMSAFIDNPNFYTNFKERAITKEIKPNKVDKSDPLSTDSLLFEYLNDHKDLKKGIMKRLNSSNSILNYWWQIAVWGVLFAISAWYLSIFLFKKKFFKLINHAFLLDKSTEFNNQQDIINYIQVKTTNVGGYEEIEKLKSENTKLQTKVDGLEKHYNDLTDEKATEISVANDLIDASEKETLIDTQREVFYFASVNRDGELGIFQDENKTFTKEVDSLYKFEEEKSNPYEAKFWFDANATMVASVLSYRSYKIEPVCTSNTFQDGYTRIIHVDKGTAILKNGKWVVEEGNKAKIRYE